jgi:hypothetical protein
VYLGEIEKRWLLLGGKASAPEKLLKFPDRIETVIVEEE